MGFNVHQARRRGSSSEATLGFFSDLFAALSFIFLFLYITSALQSNIQGVADAQKQQEIDAKYQKKLDELTETYNERIKVFEGEAPTDNKMVDQLIAKVEVIEDKNQNTIKQRKDEIAKAQAAIAKMENELNEANSLREMVKLLTKAKNRAVKKMKQSDKEARLAELKKKNAEETLQEVQEVTKKRIEHSEKVMAQAKKKAQQLVANTKKNANQEILLAQQKAKDEIKQTKELAENQIRQTETKAESIVSKALREAEQLVNKTKQEADTLVKKTKQQAEREILDSKHAAEQVVAKTKQEADYLVSTTKNEAAKQIANTKLTAQQLLDQTKQNAERKVSEARIAAEKALLQKEQELEQKVRSLNHKFDEAERKLMNEKSGVEGELEKLKAAKTAAEIAYRKKLIDRENKIMKLSTTANRAQREGDLLKKEKDLLAKENASLLSLQQKVASKNQELALLRDKLSNNLYKLKSKVLDKEADLAKLKMEKNALEKQKKIIEKQKDEISKKAKTISKNMKVRRKLAKQLSKAFKKMKLPAYVNLKTSEVVIPFKNAYFDFGQFALNYKIKKILRDILPVFSATLFKELDVKNDVKSLEMVGYSSPIYKGRIVHGTNLEEEGLRFNVDLSYKRAKAIFNYVFDSNSFKFNHQRDMMKLTKVTSVGHNWTTLKPTGGAYSPLKYQKASPGQRLCMRYNCEEWQKVTIRINLIGD